MQNEMFDMVEELAGTYPDSDSLRNAIYAVITKGLNSTWYDVLVVNPVAARNVEHLARTYEHVRGISMTIGTRYGRKGIVFVPTGGAE